MLLRLGSRPCGLQLSALVDIVFGVSGPQVPLMGVSGNHEIEPDSRNNKFQAYETRYRFPYKESGSTSQHWYSFDVAGAAMTLCI